MRWLRKEVSNSQHDFKCPRNPLWFKAHLLVIWNWAIKVVREKGREHIVGVFQHNLKDLGNVKEKYDVCYYLWSTETLIDDKGEGHFSRVYGGVYHILEGAHYIH
ncbi:hypothetical protein ACJX0J_040105 [Zea mays]